MSKSNKKGQPSTSMASELDMYADDFDSKEKEKLGSTTQSTEEEVEAEQDNIGKNNIIIFV